MFPAETAARELTARPLLERAKDAVGDDGDSVCLALVLARLRERLLFLPPPLSLLLLLLLRLLLLLLRLLLLLDIPLS